MSALLKRVIADLVNYAFASLIFANLPSWESGWTQVCVDSEPGPDSIKSGGISVDPRHSQASFAAPRHQVVSESVLEDR